MPSMLQRYFAGIGAALAAALVFPVLAQEPIKVGVTLTKSPPGSVVQGTQVTQGLEVALEIINSAGGVKGRPIQLIYEDDQGVPERGRAATEKLITRDNVVAITGTHASGVALGQIEVIKNSGVPFINTNAWSDDIRKKGAANVFNPSNYNSRVAKAMAEVIRDMKVKRVLAYPENTDYGIGQSELLKKFIAEFAPGVEFKYEALDRAGKDFLPAVIALKRNPPDMVVIMLLPPAAYIFMNQLYEQGVAPSKKTWLYDGAGIADYPDFWQNTKEAARYMISFGLYHPAMKLPPLGEKVRDAYQAKHKIDASRLIFQAADSLFLIAEAVKVAGGTDKEAMNKALRGMKYTGARGTIEFSQEPGFTFQQWVEVPYVTYQLTEVNQKIGDAPLVQAPGMPLDPAKLKR